LQKAAETAVKENPNLLFVLAGTEESTGFERFSVKELDSNFLYIGERNDIDEVYRACDIFTLPTFYREGIPRSILEASASGLPVVASRMPGCLDAVAHNSSGLLVEPKNPQELAQALVRLSTSPQLRRDMGEAGRRRVGACFSLESISQQYADAYFRLVQESPLRHGGKSESRDGTADL